MTGEKQNGWKEGKKGGTKEKRMKAKKEREKRDKKKTRPSRPIRCDMWIVERMRYPTDRQTDRPMDTSSYRGALSHLKRKKKES